jgi:hypothetical protein
MFNSVDSCGTDDSERHSRQTAMPIISSRLWDNTNLTILLRQYIAGVDVMTVQSANTQPTSIPSHEFDASQSIRRSPSSHIMHIATILDN